MIVSRALSGLGSLPRPPTALALPGPLPLEVESPVKGIVMPVHGQGGQMAGLAGRASVPRTVHGLVDGGAPTVTCLAPLLPICGLGGPSCGLWTATGLVGCAHTLGVTVRGLDECAHVRLAVARPGVTGPGHTGPATGHVTALPTPQIVRGLESRVGSLGGVAGIAWRFWPPGIAATLGREWNLLLWLRAAPLLCSHPPCRT